MTKGPRAARAGGVRLPAALLLLTAAACADVALDGDGAAAGFRPAACAAGATRCAAGGKLETCAPGGDGWVVEDCTRAGGRCDASGGRAACVRYTCQPRAGACAADGLTTQTCDPTGSRWLTGRRCDVSRGEICHAGTCQRACDVAAKSKQNVGCTFYPTNLDNNRADTVGVVVSNPGRYPARVILSEAKGLVGQAEVPPGGLVTLKIKPRHNMLKGSGKAKTAFKLVSTLPVAAYQFSPLNRADQRSNDASLLLPRAALGRRHYALSTPVTVPGDGRTYVTVVATAPKTRVTIRPAAPTDAGGGVPALQPGQRYTVVLDEQEVLQVASASLGADLSGTLVESDKPVAVFGGNACAFLPRDKSFCDHIEEQMFPVETWGKAYIAVKYQPRGREAEDDWWRIVAAEDGTLVTLDGQVGLPPLPPLKAGEIFLVKSDGAFTVTANKPVALGHYLLGQAAVRPPVDTRIFNETFQTQANCVRSGTALGDPALAMAVPFEQFRRDYIFLTPDTYRYDFLTLLVAASAEHPDIRIDGKPLAAKLLPIGGTGYRYARLRVGDGPHTVRASVPVGIEVHGYDCNVSYAYGGGLSLAVLNPLK